MGRNIRVPWVVYSNLKFVFKRLFLTALLCWIFDLENLDLRGNKFLWAHHMNIKRKMKETWWKDDRTDAWLNMWPTITFGVPISNMASWKLVSMGLCCSQIFCLWYNGVKSYFGRFYKRLSSMLMLYIFCVKTVTFWNSKWQRRTWVFKFMF